MPLLASPLGEGLDERLEPRIALIILIKAITHQHNEINNSINSCNSLF